MRLTGQPGLDIRVDGPVYVVHHVIGLVRLLPPLLLRGEFPLQVDVVLRHFLGFVFSLFLGPVFPVEEGGHGERALVRIQLRTERSALTCLTSHRGASLYGPANSNKHSGALSHSAPAVGSQVRMVNGVQWSAVEGAVELGKQSSVPVKIFTN